MKKMKRLLCLVIAVLLSVTSIPMTEAQVEAAPSYTLTNYANGSGFEVDCLAHSYYGLARTFAEEWFKDTSEDVIYRVTTGNCTANEANNAGPKILLGQAVYRPNSSPGIVKNGVYTPYRTYWNPQEPGACKVWKLVKQNGVYRATDSNCISFYLQVMCSAEIVVEAVGGISVPEGKVIIEGKGEYGNDPIVWLEKGKNYAVSAKNIPGFKVKSLSHTSVSGASGLKIKLVYEATETCNYEVEDSDYGNLSVDNKTGNFDGAVGVGVTINASAHHGVSGTNLYANTIEGIYVNGTKLENVTYSNHNRNATVTYTPKASGNHKVTVKYNVNELKADTSKVYVCSKPTENVTALELFDYIYGECLETLPEADRPQITENDVTYLAGIRYVDKWDPLKGVTRWTYDCYLKFSESLPGKSGPDMMGQGEGFVGSGHFFASDAYSSGTATEKIRINIPATGVFPGGTVTMDVNITKSGMTLNSDVAVGKGENAYSCMVSSIGAKFRGSSSDLFSYTDKAGNVIDQAYLMSVPDGETIDAVVTYLGDSTYGRQKKTVSLTVLPEIKIEATGTAIEKGYDGRPVSVSTENGVIFQWNVREGIPTTQTVLYYNEDGELLSEAPKNVGNYTAKLQVSDASGTVVSEEVAVITIRPGDVGFYIPPVPAKTYGDAEFKLSAFIVGGPDITYSSENENVVKVNEQGYVTIVGAGSAKIKITAHASENYKEATASTVIYVNKANPVLKFAEIEEMTYGDTVSLQITEQTEGMGKVYYSTSDATVATVDANGIITSTGAGEAVIKASYPATANYNAGAVEIPVKVVRAQASVTVTTEDKVYDAEEVEVGYTTENTKGRVIKEYKLTSEDDAAYTTTAPKNVGEYTVRVTVQESNQYYEASGTAAFKITPKTLSVGEVTIENEGYIASKEYDGTNDVPVQNVKLSGVCGWYDYAQGKYTWNWEDVSADLSNMRATVESADAGIYDTVTLTGLELTGEDVSNYVLDDTLVYTYSGGRYFAINERFVSYTVDNQTITVDGVYTDDDGYVQHGTYIVDGETKEIDELIDKTKYSIDESSLVEGHRISGVNLSAEGSTIGISFEILDSEDNDVSYNYHNYGHRGMIDIVIDCDNHGFDENGFCPNCANYEPAQGVADEFGTVTYDIYNAGQLFWFAQQVNEKGQNSARARLMADIDLNPGFIFNSDGTITYEGKAVTSGWRAWTPIGDENIFSGFFDGQGHLISGVYIIRENDKAGLFGWIDYNPTVQDLHLTNSYIKGGEYVGAVGGYFNANMKNCTVDTSVTVVGKNWVGGFAGSAGTGEIINCASAATVITLNEDMAFAGLVAKNSSEISNSYCTTGKLVAYNDERYGGSLTNCFYLDESETDEYNGTTAVTAEQFASGEITYLLQQGQKAEQEWDDDLQDFVEVGVPDQIWGQNIDLEGFEAYDPLPVLHGPKVYYGYVDCKATEAIYSNAELSTSEGKHKYPENVWEKEESGHWQECIYCEEPTEIENHTYGNWLSDEENHWKECSCGYVTEKGSHAYENGECSICEKMEPTPTVTETPDPTETEAPQPTEEVTAIFDDIYTDWYTDYVQYVYDNGLMTGIKGTNNFEPNSNITKAQVAQVLYNMEGQPEVEKATVFDELTDVYAVEWYANAVAWAYDTGVATGDTNTQKFNPNADVTREQLALMMYRYAKYKGYDVSATSDLAGLNNAENTSNWAVDGVKWAVGSGLISGVDKGGVKDLDPQGNATRAQMAAILQRFCEAND